MLTSEFLDNVPAGRSYQNGVSTASGVSSGSTRGGGALEDDVTVSDSTTRRRPAREARAAERLRNKAEGPPPPPRVVAAKPAAPSTTSTPMDPRQQVVPESHTEQYTDYGVNGFTLTERDGLSTSTPPATRSPGASCARATCRPRPPFASKSS